jgi:hypothetical protein
MKNVPLLLILTVAMVCQAQAQQPGPNLPPAENVPEISYHLVTFMPQYRFLSTGGNPSRVGEYDSLQQSFGGDLSLSEVYVPQHMTLRYTATFLSGNDYDMKARLNFGKWIDLGFDSRSFIRHLDDNSFFGASVMSPDIIRTDSIPADSLLGIRRRMNSAHAKVKLPELPIKLFVKTGWQARDGVSQMQYYDMGGSGLRTDTQCDNCHSASQSRTINYTTRNIAGGAEATLGQVKLIYQHEFRSFNDRRQNPVDFFGTAGSPDEPFPPGPPQAPVTPAGFYVHSVLPSHQTQADSLQVSMAVMHHLTFNGNASYARTLDLFTNHNQNAFNADATLAWNPIAPLRVVADFHQQNLLNEFVPFYFLFGNPSLHRHWTGLKLAYRATRQVDLETYYKRMNITRSNASLWPQAYSPGNFDPLMVIPASFSNLVGMAVHFHTNQFWNVRAGYEWTGTHAPGYVTDPGTNNSVFGDVTITPVQWFTFTNDLRVILQRSFPAVQRSNNLYTETSFVTIRPIPQWSIRTGYTYLQDNLQTDMRFSNDADVGLFNQALVPYKEFSQTYSIGSTYELKKRLGLNLNFAHSTAHSGFRPDINPATYPVFPGAVSVAGYPSDAAFAQTFANALALGAGQVSQVDVPQAILGAIGDYHFPSGYDAGLRFNYGSYTDYIRPDLNGKLRSYTAFFGRTW